MSDKHFGFTGFKLATKAGTGNNSHVPPPGNSTKQAAAKQPVEPTIRPSYAPSFSRKHKTEEGYFEDEEEQDMPANAVDTDLQYQPAPDSPVAKQNQDDDEEEDEDDPLDCFMAGIEVGKRFHFF